MDSKQSSKSSKPRAQRDNKGIVALAAAGVVLVGAGVPMLVLPGPGLVATGCGVACLAKAAHMFKNNRK